MIASMLRSGQLIDRFGRVARDLRISLTDRCNLRCTYCMPAEGLAWMPMEAALDVGELARLAMIFRGLGIERVRLTGGEPLLRPDLASIVASLAAFDDLALSTNGIGLAARARSLADAGLRRINVSLDSLDPERYRSITRRGDLRDVIDGIEAAVAVGLAPVKVNTVLQRGVNDDEVEAFIAYARSTGVEVRFIEWMPMDAQRAWRREDVVPSDEVLARVRACVGLVPRVRGSAPARSFSFADGAPGGIGVIGTVTEPFCDACDRIRLSADGMLKTCLFAEREIDLRAHLRDGSSDDDIAATIRTAVAGKAAGHGIDEPGFVPPTRSMSAIGG